MEGTAVAAGFQATAPLHPNAKLRPGGLSSQQYLSVSRFVSGGTQKKVRAKTRLCDISVLKINNCVTQFLAMDIN